MSTSGLRNTARSRRFNSEITSNITSIKAQQAHQSANVNIRHREMRRWGLASCAFVLTATLGLSTCILGVNAQGGPPSEDPRDLICLFDNHRTIVTGDTLFVDGGEWAPKDTFRENGTAALVVKWQTTITGFLDEYLWRLDLTKPFNASAPPWEIEKKPDSNDAHYNGAQATVWDFGVGTFTTVGGWFSPYHGPPGKLYSAPLFTGSNGTYTWTAPTPRIFTYDLKKRTWSNTLLPKDVSRVSANSWTSSQRLRRGWTLGGLETIEQANSMHNPDSTSMYDMSRYLNTMTEYNFINNTWATTNLPNGIGNTVDGLLVSLDRVGEQGVLVFLGGEERWTNGTTLEQVYQRRSMETIWIYDIASKEWLSQPTSGTVPPGRRASCYVVVPAPDLSSYQIYVFSGSLAGEIGLLDLYVLSIPSFIWTKIDVSSAGYPEKLGMSVHQCGLHSGGRQMLVVPGIRNASITAQDYQFGCNPRTAVRVFDTEKWVFRDTFDPGLKGAKVPPGIIKQIGGNGDGGATMKQPKEGWASGSATRLGEIFAKRNQPIIYPDSNSTTSGPSPTDIPSGEKNATNRKSLPAGSIAGITVGSVIGLAFIIFLLLCILKRRKERSGYETAELQGTGGTRAEIGSGPFPVQRHELGGYEPHELMDQRVGGYYQPEGVKRESLQREPDDQLVVLEDPDGGNGTRGEAHPREGYYTAKS